MKLFTFNLAALFFAASLASGQTFTRSPAVSAAPANNNAQLEALAKKIDEQNTKIDLLSQQILKLEQQLSNSTSSSGSNLRPGVMIGESAPATATTPPPAQPSSPAPAANGTTHIVARGETLTAIAKMYKVTVDELQKYNHIENPTKLQVGQTIAIPSPAGASPSGQ
jgi:LysM repeat protein